MKPNILVLGLFLVAATTEAQTRRDLKKMCKEIKKECRSEGGSRKECRQLWKECRSENGVTFKDDLNLVKRALADSVHISKGEDELGDYYQVQVRTKKLARFSEFSFSPNGIQSKIELVQTKGQQLINFTVYQHDIYQNINLTNLQTSQGRSFPRFYDGRIFDSLLGVSYQMPQGQKVHLYLDPVHSIFGLYIEGHIYGNAFNWVNNLKKSVKWLSFIPDITHVPFAIKVRKEKAGRIYALAFDEAGENAGVLLLLDEQRLFEIL